MGLSTEQQIWDRLKAAYDPNRYTQLYRLARSCFGDFFEQEAIGPLYGASGTFPYFPELMPRVVEYGVNNNIMNTAIYALANTMYTAPEPDFPDLPNAVAEVRKAYFQHRFQGLNDCGGDWDKTDAKVFLDMDTLGLGHAYVGLDTNPKTGKQYVQTEHVPALCGLYDIYAATPSQSRFFCIVRYVPTEEFAATWGQEKADMYSREIGLQDSSSVLHQIPFVRTFEYYDIGCGGNKPTHAILPVDITYEPLLIEKNPFGAVLPIAFSQNVILPTMRYPTGRGYRQMASAKMLAEFERYFRKALAKGSPVDLMDMGQVSEEDIKEYLEGEPFPMVQVNSNNPEQAVLVRVPGTKIEESTFQIMEHFEQNYNADSGTTDFARGNMNPVARTATENNLLNQQSQTTGSWSIKQTLEYYRQLVKLVCLIGARYDKDPLTLNLFGDRRISFNDPKQPLSSLQKFLDPSSRVVIAEDSLQKTDLQSKQLFRLQQLMDVIPVLTQTGEVNPEWVARELLLAIGTNDPSEAMNGSPADIQKKQQLQQQAAQDAGVTQPGAPGGVAPNPYQQRAEDKANVIGPPYQGPVTVGSQALPV